MYQDKKAPMAAAPMKYDENGKPIWDQMWDDFCGLAAEGGPSHKETKDRILFDKEQTEVKDQNKLNELVRGLKLLKAKTVETGRNLVKIDLGYKYKADWYAKVINLENVSAKVEESKLILPYSDKFDIEKEIKSLLTVWGKANHYWNNHRPVSIRIFMRIFKYDPIAKLKLES